VGRRSDPRWREQAALDLLNGRFLSALPADASGPILFVDESGPGAARGIDVQVEHWRREAHFDTPGAVVPPEGPFGIVCIRIPRSREALTYAVRQSASRLRPGGFVVVYGANDEGVGSAGSSLDEVGVQEVVTWASGKRCRVLGGRLPEPPVSQDPDSVRLGYTLQLPGLEPRPWVSWPGVFASERLDAGTRLLLESLPVLDPADTVLDWGAGSGEIGAFVKARDGVQVTLLERDALAAEAARINVPDARVLAGDGWGALPPDARFSHILANPPYHVGKAESIEPVLDFLQGVPEHLLPGGELRFVVQRRLRIQPVLEAAFKVVESVADDGPFRVWRATSPI